MSLNKIKNTLRYIDKRIENYSLPLFTRIVFTYTKNENKTKNAEFLLRTALRIANFFDFFYETLDKDYLNEAIKYKKVLYSSIKQNDKKDLELIEKEIIHFFDYEKQIWSKVKAGKIISDNEIEKFIKMKSSDALFYGRIIKIFTPKKDFTSLIYTNMQILDIMSDIQEYTKDFEKNQPNILYMKLSQRMENDKIPSGKQAAIKLAKQLGVYLWIIKTAKNIFNSANNFDFGSYEFIKDSIREKYNIINKEFEIK